ncbi:pilus assembly protein [Hyalangium gracile]|uniref:pilus assembly protein n=1 Tax=Hyalangium gracile TaxID=394092 RepID=UPI001CCFD165|nr:pilus assembly protein [Hyalangium gracile]
MRTLVPQRGQTLVLFALTLLLVSLMVVMTLSFSVKVRERIELQTVADATAFTNAVATARTFNNIAVLSRAQIAHGVAQLGAQSLISWTTLYRSYLAGAKKSFKDSQWPYELNRDIGCPCAWTNKLCAKMCKCGKKGVSDLKKLQSALQKEDTRVDKIFKSMDAAAGREVLYMQIAMLAMYAEQQEVFLRLKDKLEGQELADPILDKVSEGGNRAEWRAPPAGGSVSKDEVAGGAVCTGDGAVCDPLPLTVANSVNAAMGSRGWTFTTKRSYDMPHLINMLRVVRAPDIAIPHSGEGNAFFTQNGPMGLLPPYAPTAAAHDEGSVFTLYMHMANGGGLPCPPVMPGSVGPNQIKVDLKAGMMPQHRWMGGQDQSPFVHFLTPCTGGPSSCPGVWPAFLDYNVLQVADEGNNFGQPKNFAVIQRDSSQRGADPWNLEYSFQFTPTSPGTFDASLNDPMKNVATGFSTGVAYYHRGSAVPINVPVLGGDHWSEPPNLLNPYWRATLVAPDVDDDARQDAVRALNSSGAGEYGAAFDALIQQGYGGY